MNILPDKNFYWTHEFAQFANADESTPSLRSEALLSLGKDYCEKNVLKDIPISTNLFALVNGDALITGSELEGGLFEETLSFLRQVIEKMGVAHSHLKKVLQDLQDNLNWTPIAIVNQINNLSIGEEFYFPGSWYKHAVIYKIGNQDNGFTFSIINSGDGLENHTKKQFGDVVYFSPILTSIGIKKESIIQLDLWKDLKQLPHHCNYQFRPSEAIYNNLFFMLQGNQEWPSDNVWVSGQYAGTCTWKCLTALMKLLIPKEDYKELICRIKLGMVAALLAQHPNPTRVQRRLMKETLRSIGVHHLKQELSEEVCLIALGLAEVIKKLPPQECGHGDEAIDLFTVKLESNPTIIKTSKTFSEITPENFKGTPRKTRVNVKREDQCLILPDKAPIGKRIKQLDRLFGFAKSNSDAFFVKCDLLGRLDDKKIQTKAFNKYFSNETKSLLIPRFFSSTWSEATKGISALLSLMMTYHKWISLGPDKDLIQGYGIRISEFLHHTCGKSLHASRPREMKILKEACEYFDGLDDQKGTLFDYLFKAEGHQVEFLIDRGKEPYGEYQYIDAWNLKYRHRSDLSDVSQVFKDDVCKILHLPGPLGHLQRLFLLLIGGIKSHIYDDKTKNATMNHSKKKSDYYGKVTFCGAGNSMGMEMGAMGTVSLKPFISDSSTENICYAKDIPPHQISIYYAGDFRLDALITFYRENPHLLFEKKEFDFFEEVFRREALSLERKEKTCLKNSKKCVKLLRRVADHLIESRKNQDVLNSVVHLMILTADYYRLEIPQVGKLFENLPKELRYLSILAELYLALPEINNEQSVEMIKLSLNRNEEHHILNPLIYKIIPQLMENNHPLNRLIQEKFQLDSCPDEKWVFKGSSFLSQNYQVSLDKGSVSKRQSDFTSPNHAAKSLVNGKTLYGHGQFEDFGDFYINQERNFVMHKGHKKTTYHKIGKIWYQYAGNIQYCGNACNLWYTRRSSFQQPEVRVMGSSGFMETTIVKTQKSGVSLKVHPKDNIMIIDLSKQAYLWNRIHPFYKKFRTFDYESEPVWIHITQDDDQYKLLSISFPSLSLTLEEKEGSLHLVEYPGFSVSEDQTISGFDNIDRFVVVQNHLGKKFLFSSTALINVESRDKNLNNQFYVDNSHNFDWHFIPLNSDGGPDPGTQTEALFTAILYLFDNQPKKAISLLLPLASWGFTDKRFQKLCYWILSIFSRNLGFNHEEMAVLDIIRQIIWSKNLFTGDTLYLRNNKFRRNLLGHLKQRHWKKLMHKHQGVPLSRKGSGKVINKSGLFVTIDRLKQYVKSKEYSKSERSNLDGKFNIFNQTHHIQYLPNAINTIVHNFGLGSDTNYKSEDILAYLSDMEIIHKPGNQRIQESLNQPEFPPLSMTLPSSETSLIHIESPNLKDFVMNAFTVSETCKDKKTFYFPQLAGESRNKEFETSDWTVEFIDSLNAAASENPLQMVDVSLNGITAEELQESLKMTKDQLKSCIELKIENLRNHMPRIDYERYKGVKMRSLASPQRKWLMDLFKVLARSFPNQFEGKIPENCLDEIFNLLIHELTDLGKVNRALKCYESTCKSKGVNIKTVYSILNAERLYNPYEHKEWVVREYLGNILYNSKQVDFFSKKYKTALYHIPIGHGKTSVILRDLALELSKEKLPIIIVPSSLFGQNVQDLQYNSKKIYGQDAFPFVFNRDMALNEVNINTILITLKNIKLKKGYFITTVESLQSLYLFYIQCLKDESKIPLKVRSLVNEVISIIRHDGVAVGDEVHLTLLNLKDLTYGIAREPIPGTYFDASMEVFKQLVNFEIPIHDPERASRIFEENRDNILTALFPGDIEMQSVVGITEKASYFHSQMDEARRKKAALYQTLFEEIIPFTLQQVFCVDYGPSNSQKNHLAKPYVGNNEPCERADFAHPLVYIMLTLQMNWIQGISPEKLKDLLSLQIEVLNELQIQDIPEEVIQDKMGPFLRLKKWGGFNFAKIFEAKNDYFRSFLLRVKEEPQYRYDLLSLLVNELRPQMKYDAVKLSASPHDLVQWLFPQFIALTGTPENAGTFSHEIALNIQSDYQSWGALMNVTDNPTSQELCVLDSMEPGDILTFLSEERKEKNVRAIVDLGYRFQGISNLEAAQMILDKLSDIEGVVYYATHSESREPSSSSVLLADNEDEAAQTGQSMIVLRNGKQLPFHPDHSSVTNYFVYYDQRRSSGWDIPLPDDAAFYVTVVESVDFSLIYQAKGRARKLTLGQTAQLMISSELAGEAKSRFEIDEIYAKHIELMAIYWQSKNLQMEMIASVTQQLRMLGKIHFLNTSQCDDAMRHALFYDKDPGNFLNHLKLGLTPISSAEFLPDPEGYSGKEKLVVAKIVEQTKKILFKELPRSISSHLNERSETQSETETESLQKSQLQRLKPFDHRPIDWNLLLVADHFEPFLSACYDAHNVGLAIGDGQLYLTGDFWKTLVPSEHMSGPLKSLGFWLEIKADGRLKAVLISSTEAAYLIKQMDGDSLSHKNGQIILRYRFGKPVATILEGDCHSSKNEMARIHSLLGLFDVNIRKLSKIENLGDYFLSFDAFAECLKQMADLRGRVIEERELKVLKKKFLSTSAKRKDKRRAGDDFQTGPSHRAEKRSKPEQEEQEEMVLSLPQGEKRSNTEETVFEEGSSGLKKRKTDEPPPIAAQHRGLIESLLGGVAATSDEESADSSLFW